MKKFELLRHFALISFAVGFLFVLSSCEKSITNSTSDEQDDVEKYDYVSSVDQQMAASLDSINVPGLPVCIATYLDSLPTEEISESELSTLRFVREEEFLAHDVYVALYEKYTIPVFNNISKSETFHTSMILALLQKYGIEDPAANHQSGVFVDPELQEYYDQLMALGNTSLNDAIIVGATIEDLDIADLVSHLEEDVDNEDISFVLTQLSKGSRNHLRAFNAHLTFRNLTYNAQFISQEYYDEIVQSDWEVGGGICGVCP
ncbi:MAG: DUF2202 domain-containing protein [Bacteroidetes bacterium]|nr:DUF2202 domain-containing protein [Bacteroidota bacterium]MBU1579052.1 DUF2202 domain-containing protein [Bacteroidota bacterium]MBU2557370.1 DUF2202 domain-containing protein [Bacteroidota bacterium]